MILPYIIPIISQLSSHWIPWNPHEKWPLESPLKSPRVPFLPFLSPVFSDGDAVPPFRTWRIWLRGSAIWASTVCGSATAQHLGRQWDESGNPGCRNLDKSWGGWWTKTIGIEWNWWELMSKKYRKWGMAIQELMGFNRGFDDDFTGSLRPGNHGPVRNDFVNLKLWNSLWPPIRRTSKHGDFQFAKC